MIIDYNLRSPFDSAINTIGSLQGIEANKQKLDQYKQQQGAFQQQQQVREQAVNLLKSGSPDDIAEFSIRNPEIMKDFVAAANFKDKTAESGRVNYAKDILSGGVDPVAAITERIQQVQQSGGDAQGLIRTLEGGPNAIVEAAKKDLAVMAPDVYKSYASTQEQSGAPNYSNIQFDEAGNPYGLNKSTGQFEPVKGGFQRAKPTAQTVVNVGKAEGEQQKTIAKAEGDVYNSIQKSGFDSRKSDASLNRLENLSEKAFEGITAGAYTMAAKLGEAAGLKVDGLTETELFRALSNELVLDQTSKLTGVLTDKDMAFLEQTVPQLSQTKEGRKQLIGIMKEINAASREKAKLAKEFRDKNNGYFDTAEFESYLENKQPKDRFAKDEDKLISGQIVDGYEYLGGDPSLPASWRQL